MDAETLDWLKEKVGSYEGLFSKRAIKYRSLGLNEQVMMEVDYREWLLKEYTFLKRPVIIHGEDVFVGNAKKEVEAARAAFQS
jgi:arsenate reductase